MLTLITATGSRPQAWELCQHFMHRQTYAGPVRWIIVDDGETAQPISFERAGWTLEVLRPEPFWRPGDNTQSRNLLLGLEHVSEDDRLVFIEDDDWYSAHWLEIVNQRLNLVDLVGERLAFYYNLRFRKYSQLRNGSHASLCSTAIKGRVIPMLEEICKTRPKFIDLALWRLPVPRRLFTSREVIGMKGLPGREGIGMGHQPPSNFKPDPTGELLRTMIGSDADLYFNLTLN